MTRLQIEAEKARIAACIKNRSFYVSENRTLFVVFYDPDIPSYRKIRCGMLSHLPWFFDHSTREITLEQLNSGERIATLDQLTKKEI